MIRRLQYINLFGVLALSALCLTQWLRDRRLNIALSAAQSTRITQDARLEEQFRVIDGLHEDLAQMKTAISNELSLRIEAEASVKTTLAANDRLAAESARLSVALTQWADAVAARDERLQRANSRIEELSSNLNTAIAKYNTLATNYNSVIGQQNSVQVSRAP